MARSNKTSQVMRLVASGNPVFFSDGKPSEGDGLNFQQYSDAEFFPHDENADGSADSPTVDIKVKRKKSRRRAITKNMKLETEGVMPPGLKMPRKVQDFKVPPVYTKPAGERQVVNVVSILINEQLGTALERFNACACPKCCLEITQRVMREVTPVFVHVSTDGDANTVNEKLFELRPEVTRLIAKTVMAGRVKPYHKQ